MNAEIIAVGTELTSGAKLDTNSQWLSLQLADLGIPVVYHTTVADDLEANVDVLHSAVERVDLIILTGGLGPTRDDLTRYALAQLNHGELVLDQASLNHLQDFFASRGRPMPESNKVQALFPSGSSPLENPIGTAPGIWMPISRVGKAPCLIACLPGVPSEMKKMYIEQVMPKLPGTQRVIRRARINCFGLGESATEELLGELTARKNDPEIGITAHDATITLRIIAQGASAAECDRKIQQASAEIHSKLADYIFGVEDEQLEDVVVRELNRFGKTVVTVESGTKGLLAHWLTQVPENETCFLKGVSVPILKKSPEEIALITQQESGADHVLVLGDEEVEISPTGKKLSTIPMVILSQLENSTNMQKLEHTWNGNPSITYSKAVKTALNILRISLIKTPV